MAKSKIQKMENELKNFESQWNSIFFQLYGQPPELVYHYTNTDGLLGILESNNLWCSNSTFLNDASELQYALDVIRFQIERKKEEYNDPAFSKLLDGLLSFYDGYFEAYVVCFSEEVDLLSQWRAYGANGNGYAIGFDFSQLTFLKPFTAFTDATIRKVEYDLDKQMGLVGYILDSSYSLFELLLGSLKVKEELFRDRLILLLSWKLADLALFFKHPSFSEEKEWRVIHLLSPHVENHNYFSNLEFRSAGGRIIPYVNIGLFPPNSQYKYQLPIKKILHGPTLNPEITKKALELLKRKNNFDDVAIEGSTVPLRL